MRNRTGDEGRQTGGVAARAHIHVHIHILIRWQVDTSSTVALYSHTMCNLEQRRAPSSRSSWPNKHGIIIFSWICRSKRGAQPPRPLAAGDRRSFTQVAWGSHPFLRAADTALCAARSGLACSATRGVYAILRRTASSPVRDHSWCLSWFLVLLFAHFILFRFLARLSRFRDNSSAIRSAEHLSPAILGWKYIWIAVGSRRLTFLL